MDMSPSGADQGVRQWPMGGCAMDDELRIRFPGGPGGYYDPLVDTPELHTGLLDLCRELLEWPSFQAWFALPPGLRPEAPRDAFALEAVLKWCSKHGPLGVLQHRLRVARLSPVLGAADRAGVATEARQRCFSLHAGAFQEHTHTRMLGPNGLSDSGLEAQSGLQVEGVVNLPRDGLVDAHFDRPGARVVFNGKPDISPQPFSAYVARFFPDVGADERETYQYPIPGTAAFWAGYAEPFDEFVKAAFRIYEIHDGLTRRLMWTPDDQAKFRGALHWMREVLEPVSAVLVPRPGRGRMGFGFRSPSLLGYAAVSLSQAAERSHVAHRCAVCDRVVDSPDWRIRWCDEHREAGRKRQQEAKKAGFDREAFLSEVARSV